jgi:hypothetical protein
VGRCLYVDQDVYEGEWRGDMRHGWGRLRWADGGMYQGSWVKVRRVCVCVRVCVCAPAIARTGVRACVC